MPAVITGIVNVLPFFGVAIPQPVVVGITTVAIFFIGIFAKDGNISGTGEAAK